MSSVDLGNIFVETLILALALSFVIVGVLILIIKPFGKKTNTKIDKVIGTIMITIGAIAALIMVMLIITGFVAINN